MVNWIDLAQTAAIVWSLYYAARSHAESVKWKERPQVISLMRNVLAVIDNMLKDTTESCYNKVHSYLREQVDESSLNLLTKRFLDKRWWRRLRNELESLEEMYQKLQGKYNELLKLLEDEINRERLRDDSEVRKIIARVYSTEFLAEGFRKLARDLIEHHKIGKEYPSYEVIWRKLSAKYPENDRRIKLIIDLRKEIRHSAENIRRDVRKEIERLIERYKLTPEEFEEEAHKRYEEVGGKYRCYIGFSEVSRKFELRLLEVPRTK